MKTKRLVTLTLLMVLLLMMLSACAATPVATAPVAPELTVAPTSPPTTAPTARPQPSPTYPAEVVAGAPADVQGVWQMIFNAPDPVGKFTAYLTLRADSTFYFENHSDGYGIFSGTLRFADGKVTLENTACDVLPAGRVGCAMRFVIHSSILDGRPLRLRFESVDHEDLLFVTQLDGKSLYPVTP